MNQADDFGVDCVLSDPNYDLKNCLDSAQSVDGVYNNVEHSCKYYDMEEFIHEFSHEPRKFSTFSFNIRSLPGNWIELQDLITGVNKGTFKFAVVAVQEVWNVPPNASYNLPGYKPFYYKIRDPSGLNSNAGGGVGLWVDDELEYEEIKELSIFVPHFFESQFIKVKTSNTKFSIIGNIYRPNSGPQANLRLFLEKLEEILCKIESDPVLSKCEDVQLVGDFNIDLLNYKHHSLTGQYADSLLAHGHMPLITQPTRIFGRSATIIDHITTTYRFDRYKAGILLSYISDHMPTFYVRQTPIKSKVSRTIKKRKINENTTPAFKTLLESVPWNIVTEENRPKQAFEKFFERLDVCGDMAFPIVEQKISKRVCPLKPWMTSGLLKSRRQKEKLAAKKMRCPTLINIENYRVFNSIYNKIKRAAIKLYYEGKFQEHKRNVKGTWDTIREALGSRRNKEKLPNTFKIGDTVVTNAKSVASGFNDFFANIGKDLVNQISDSARNFREFLGERVVVDFIFAPLTPQIIYKIANKIKPKNSCGPDYISSKLLKDILPIIINPLCHVFNLSLQTGYIPERFKVAKVVPIFKSGDRQQFTNYRPISLLSSFSKLLERVVARQMEGFLRVNNILYKHQYGFRKEHNTFHPVLHFINNIYDALNNEMPKFCLGIFLDFKKAFDTVHRKILLEKLKHYGFRGVANHWFENYLQGRKQFVSIDGVDSELSEIEFGVPQGSVLGPLLFLLFINDLDKATNFSTFMFADDTTFQLSAQNLLQLTDTANNELEKASIWFKCNKLTLNASKTKFIIFRNKNMKIQGENISLKIGGETLERVGFDMPLKNLKFLGHIIDEHLSWADHISYVRSKISSGNYALARTKHLLPPNIRLILYNSLVRPHLEYGIVTWGGAQVTKLRPIEVAQRKAIRSVAGKSANSHTEPLFASLGLLKFSDLFKYNCAIFMHKYYNKCLPNSFEGMFTQLTEPNRTLGYRTPRSVNSFVDKLPSAFLPRIWNGLDRQLKTIKSHPVFKRSLQNYMISNYVTNI